jgi:site-specific recombinase XerD
MRYLTALTRNPIRHEVGCVFVNERGQPFGRMGIARVIERGGEVANLRSRSMRTCCGNSTGNALAAKGMDTRRLQRFLGHASITNTPPTLQVNANSKFDAA